MALPSRVRFGLASALFASFLPACSGSGSGSTPVMPDGSSPLDAMGMEGGSEASASDAGSDSGPTGGGDAGGMDSGTPEG
jgi:hypothetical protein